MLYTSLLCLLLCFIFNTTQASTPKNIIFFGDSLTDNGNLYRLDLHVFPKSPPYFNGRFSNGQTWAEIVGQDYYNRYNTHYKIYAWGGATSISHNPITAHTTPITLTMEVERYLLNNFFQDKSKTLFSFWIGCNDYLIESKDDINTLTSKVIDEIIGSINILIAHHAKQFLILNVPDLSRLPRYANDPLTQQHLHELSIAHNLKLNESIEKIQKKHPEITFTIVDIELFFNDILAHPEKFNESEHIHIQDTQHSCWSGGYLYRNIQNLPKPVLNDATLEKAILNSPDLYETYSIGYFAKQGLKACDQPDDYIFWDSIHPSAMTHSIIAKIVEEALQKSELEQ